jgi:hypothetical protein
VQQPLEAQRQFSEQAGRDVPHLAVLLQRFNAAMEQQNRRDSEVLAGLMRMLRKPRSADAEGLIKLIAQELDSKRNP